MLKFPHLKQKGIAATSRRFSREKGNQVNNKTQSCLVVCIIIGPYVKIADRGTGGSDICGDWLSEAASEVSDSI